MTSPTPAPEALEARARELEQKLRMVVSHATGGNSSDIDMSTNDICVEISRNRNLIYQGGKDQANKERTAALAQPTREGVSIETAREAFLNMIADADRWDEDVDGDCDGISINYDLRVGHSQLSDLCDTLGIKPKRYDETLKNVIDVLIGHAE